MGGTGVAQQFNQMKTQATPFSNPISADSKPFVPGQSNIAQNLQPVQPSQPATVSNPFDLTKSKEFIPTAKPFQPFQPSALA